MIGGKGSILQYFICYSGFIGYKQNKNLGCEMCVVFIFGLFLQWCWQHALLYHPPSQSHSSCVLVHYMSKAFGILVVGLDWLFAGVVWSLLSLEKVTQFQGLIKVQHYRVLEEWVKGGWCPRLVWMKTVVLRCLGLNVKFWGMFGISAIEGG